MVEERDKHSSADGGKGKRSMAAKRGDKKDDLDNLKKEVEMVGLTLEELTEI